LSRRFAEAIPVHAAVRGGAVALLALVVAACGASTPRRAAVEKPTVVTPAAAPKSAAPSPQAQAAVAASPKAESRAERRGRHEERRGEGAPAAEPIPAGAQSAYDRALTAMRAEDWLQAEIELEQLTHDYPAYPGPQVNLAIVYSHEGRADEARAALDRALELAPGHAAANNQLGILLRESGKFEDAQRAYRRALETDPNYALAHYNLGVLLDVYLRRGAEAIEHYEAYQSSLVTPDKTVAGWLIDLRRRFGASAPQVAKEN
jgi:tetratricopeptide (TPR) repeat protein